MQYKSLHLTHFVALVITFALIPLASMGQEKRVAVERVPWMEETKCLEMFSAMTQGPDTGLDETLRRHGAGSLSP